MAHLGVLRSCAKTLAKPTALRTGGQRLIYKPLPPQIQSVHVNSRNVCAKYGGAKPLLGSISTILQLPPPPYYNYTKYRELLASKQILKRDIKDLPLLGL
jgi:hypothetical protein